jgi:hypothetical protein
VLSEEEEAWDAKKSMMVSPTSRRNRVRSMDMANHIPSRDLGEKFSFGKFRRGIRDATATNVPSSRPPPPYPPRTFSYGHDRSRQILMKMDGA